MPASMTEKLKTLQNQLQEVSRISKTLQDSAKKLDSAKKENESKAVKDNLLKQLQQSKNLFNEIQDKICTLQNELGDDTPAAQDTTKEQTASKGDDSTDKKSSTKPKLTPEEQEVAYEHKAQMMRNLEGPNRSLQAELVLQERMNEIKHLNHQNRRLNEECRLSQINAMKLIQKFERKAREMDNKIKAMEQEVIKSGQLAQRYKDMYSQERQKNRGKQPEDTKNETKNKEMDENETEKSTIIYTCPGSDSLMGSSVRVNDIIRRNEHLTEHNSALQREIDRLKYDNGELLKKAKRGMDTAHDVMQQLNTIEKAKADLWKKFNNERAQHNQLKKSLTKQASDWISNKREQQQLQEDIRFRLISPMSPYGGYPSHQPSRAQYEGNQSTA